MVRLFLLLVLVRAVHGQPPHLICTGSGKPLVILEAGAGRTADDWAKVQREIANLTTVCSYTRVAGHCCQEIVDDLRAALREQHLAGPYLLVGHSLGGLFVRRFAAQFPGDVAGLVLVDASDERQLTGILAPGRTPELYRPGAMSDAELEAFFGGLGGGADSGSGEMRMARFYRQIAEERRDFMFGDKPVIVLTATRTPAMPRFSEEQRTRLADDHRVLQERMKLLSKNAKQVLVDCGHYIPLERPEVVTGAIREVIAGVR